MIFNKGKSERFLRFGYQTLCHLNLLQYNQLTYESLENNLGEMNAAISNFNPVGNFNVQNWLNKFPTDQISPNAQDWLLSVIGKLYTQASQSVGDLIWINELDKRGLNWVKAEICYLAGRPICSVSNEVTIDQIHAILDVELFNEVKESTWNTGRFSKLKECWEQYLFETEKFLWLKHDGFDVDSWAYNYLKSSDYESNSLNTNVINIEDYRDYFIYGYDMVRIQHKGSLLQESFIRALRAAFRVQKNRVEKASKNLASRSYDLNADTILLIDRLAKDLNKSKRTIIEEAVNLLALKIES
jgi:hypothetical protein